MPTASDNHKLQLRRKEVNMKSIFFNMFAFGFFLNLIPKAHPKPVSAIPHYTSMVKTWPTIWHGDMMSWCYLWLSESANGCTLPCVAEEAPFRSSYWHCFLKFMIISVQYSTAQYKIIKGWGFGHRALCPGRIGQDQTELSSPRKFKTRWSPRTRMPTRMLKNRNNTYNIFQRTHLWDTLTWHTEVTLL